MKKMDIINEVSEIVFKISIGIFAVITAIAFGVLFSEQGTKNNSLNYKGENVNAKTVEVMGFKDSKTESGFNNNWRTSRLSMEEAYEMVSHKPGYRCYYGGSEVFNCYLENRDGTIVSGGEHR